MTRFCPAAILLLLGSPCYAGDSYSFYVGGHRIHIESSRYCRSTSCVSVSVHGTYERRGRRDYYDDDDRYDRDEHHSRSDHDERFKDGKRDKPPVAPVAASPSAPAASPPAASPPRPASAPASPPVARAPAPLPAQASPVVPVAPPAPVQPQLQVQPPAVQPVTTAVVPSPASAAQPAPAIAAPIVVPPAPPPTPPPAIAPAADDTALPLPPVTRPKPAPRVVKVAHRVEEKPDTPLGDWETEGNKGVVRIEPCGQALCGYAVDPSTGAKGEAVLVDMKSKAASEWAGNIYSRDSGDSYYATVTLKEPNTLRVEACVLWRFWCSGNAWNRILKPGRMVTYRQISTEPRL
jgi:hypothetical protein